MFLVYCDESGDIGTIRSPSKFFVLSGIVIHELSWMEMLHDMVVFRRHLKDKYGLLLKEEIHAAEFVNGSPKLRNAINRNDRLRILIECLDFINSRTYLSVVTIRSDKSKRKDKQDVFDSTWKWFIQRIENTVKAKNFAGPNDTDKVIIIPDRCDVPSLKGIIRKMRKYNPINNMAVYGPGSRLLTVDHVIKDPIFRDSKDSYFHQMVDVVVYFARQYYECNNWLKKRGGRKYYETKLPLVTNPHVTAKASVNNIVEV